VRLCQRARLNKTQAVKLPYLVDVVANHVLGHAITGASHEAWQYGVVTSEAWRHLDRSGQVESNFALESVPFSEEKRVLVRGDLDDFPLTQDEIRVVDYVAALYSEVQATDLGELTKFMNPEVGLWGGNSRADISETAYERMSAEYQNMARDAEMFSLGSLRRISRRATSAEDMIA